MKYFLFAFVFFLAAPEKSKCQGRCSIGGVGLSWRCVIGPTACFKSIINWFARGVHPLGGVSFRDGQAWGLGGSIFPEFQFGSFRPNGCPELDWVFTRQVSGTWRVFMLQE